MVQIAGDLDNGGSVLNLDLGQGPWELAGSQITGGTVNAIGGDLTLGATGGVNTLSEVVVNANVHLSGANSQRLRIMPTATVHGALTATATNGYFQIDAPRVLQGVQVHLNGSFPYEPGLRAVYAGEVTIAPDATIDGIVGEISTGDGSSIRNHGLIRSSGAGSQITIDGDFTNAATVEAISGGSIRITNSALGETWRNEVTGALRSVSATASYAGRWENQGLVSGSGATVSVGTTASDVWSNSGVIEATGSTLTLQGHWSNTGVIRVADSNLYMRGFFTTQGIGSLEREGGSVTLAGFFDNRGQTLHLDASTGSWTLNGEMTGGTVTQSEGAILRVAAVLDSVRFTDDLHVVGSTIIRGSLQVDGTIFFDSTTASLVLPEYYTLDDTTVVFSQVSTGSNNALSGSTALTLGSGTLLRGGTGRVQSQFGRLTNNGEIRADVAGRQIQAAAVIFTNNGSVGAINGGTVNLGEFDTHWINAAGGRMTANQGNLLLGGHGLNQGLIEVRQGTIEITKNFFNEGLLAVRPTSVWTLDEGFAQAPWGSALFELAGAAPGSGFGVLAVAGTAQLGGLLSVELAEGYAPPLGTSFTLITAGTIAREFDALALPALPGSLYFDVQYGANTVVLVVVPEAASAAMPVALLVLSARRRGPRAGRSTLRRPDGAP